MGLPELYIVLMGWAAFLSPYETPSSPPPVATATLEYMRSYVCPDTMTCPVVGMYRQGTVYIRDTLDPFNDPYARSILVHEFVHHLQRINNSHQNQAHPCYRANVREIEAYGIQNAYLIHPEQTRTHVNYVPTNCGE